MKTIKILKKDFDNAVQQPWSGMTCIAAQFMLRNKIPFTNKIDPYNFARNRGFALIVEKFDCNFYRPGDEKKPELQTLRASLPITIELP